MKAGLKRFVPLIQQFCIVLLLGWSAFMVLLIWRFGAVETKEALITGKRFIVYTADGRVEGSASNAVTPKAEKLAAELAVPPVVEPTPTDVSAITSVQASSFPIVDVKEDMVDKTAGVPLPKISPAGIKPWQYYVKPFRRQNEWPLIAIIITGLGQSKEATEIALSMDDRVGLSFSPYAASVASWAMASRLTGHEMFVDLPLQTVGYPADDPGPYSLLLSRTVPENLKNLYWAMSRFQGYVGMVAPMAEVVTSRSDIFKPLASEMGKRGVMLLVGHAATQNDVKNSGAVTMNADVWIDEELTELAMQARLATLEQIAQRNGFAIGIAQSYPMSLNQIKHWQHTLGERGAVLAPVSFITKLKFN